MKFPLLAHTLRLLLALLLAPGSAASAAEIKVLCTSALQPAIEELIPEFERSGRHRIVIIYDSTALLLGRMIAGEAMDLALVTSEAIDELVKRGRIVQGSKTNLARAEVGVAVRAGARKPDLGSVDAFRRALLEAKSVAYTQTGVSGTYFAEVVIVRLGIADQVKAKSKTIPAGPVGELVASGEAEIAIQDISQLLAVRGIEVLGGLPAELRRTTLFASGMSTTAREPHAVRAFVRHLTTPAAARLFKAKGLEPGF